MFARADEQLAEKKKLGEQLEQLRDSNMQLKLLTSQSMSSLDDDKIKNQERFNKLLVEKNNIEVRILIAKFKWSAKNVFVKKQFCCSVVS